MHETTGIHKIGRHGIDFLYVGPKSIPVHVIKTPYKPKEIFLYLKYRVHHKNKMCTEYLRFVIHDIKKNININFSRNKKLFYSNCFLQIYMLEIKQIFVTR